MCTPGAVDRACQWLNGVRLYSMDLSLSKSKQLHLIDSNNSKYLLADQSRVAKKMLKKILKILKKFSVVLTRARTKAESPHHSSIAQTRGITGLRVKKWQK